MLDLKRCVIGLGKNIKVIKSEQGKVTLKNDIILRALRENKEYEESVKKSICLMKEIKKVCVNYDKLNLVIYYDYVSLSEKKVVNWVKEILEILLDNYEELINFLKYNKREDLYGFIFLKLRKDYRLDKYNIKG